MHCRQLSQDDEEADEERNFVEVVAGLRPAALPTLDAVSDEELDEDREDFEEDDEDEDRFDDEAATSSLGLPDEDLGVSESDADEASVPSLGMPRMSSWPSLTPLPRNRGLSAGPSEPSRPLPSLLPILSNAGRAVPSSRLFDAPFLILGERGDRGERMCTDKARRARPQGDRAQQRPQAKRQRQQQDRLARGCVSTQISTRWATWPGKPEQKQQHGQQQQSTKMAATPM